MKINILWFKITYSISSKTEVFKIYFDIVRQEILYWELCNLVLLFLWNAGRLPGALTRQHLAWWVPQDAELGYQSFLCSKRKQTKIYWNTVSHKNWNIYLWHWPAHPSYKRRSIYYILWHKKLLWNFMVYIIYYLTVSVCEESGSSLAGSYASGSLSGCKKVLSGAAVISRLNWVRLYFQAQSYGCWHASCPQGFCTEGPRSLLAINQKPSSVPCHVDPS